MFSPVLITSLLVVTNLLDSGYASDSSNGWHAITGSYGTGQGHDLGASNQIHDSYGDLHQGVSSYGGSYDASYGGGLDIGHQGFGGGHEQHSYAHAIPISEHIEVTKPVAVPVYKDIGVPVAQPVAIAVPHPVVTGVEQPYPVHVPVSQPVAVPVVKTVAVPVEKKVPYPIEKIIPVPIHKHVPIHVEKYIPVPVEKPYPIHIPVYKHVFHHAKGYGHHGWSH